MVGVLVWIFFSVVLTSEKSTAPLLLIKIILNAADISVSFRKKELSFYDPEVLARLANGEVVVKQKFHNRSLVRRDDLLGMYPVPSHLFKPRSFLAYVTHILLLSRCQNTNTMP